MMWRALWKDRETRAIEALYPLSDNVFGSEHAQHARGCLRGALINAFDSGVSVRGSHEIGECHIRGSGIIDELAFAGDEPAILDPPHRRPDAAACDGLS